MGRDFSNGEIPALSPLVTVREALGIQGLVQSEVMPWGCCFVLAGLAGGGTGHPCWSQLELAQSQHRAGPVELCLAALHNQCPAVHSLGSWLTASVGLEKTFDQTPSCLLNQTVKSSLFFLFEPSMAGNCPKEPVPKLSMKK